MKLLITPEEAEWIKEDIAKHKLLVPLTGNETELFLKLIGRLNEVMDCTSGTLEEVDLSKFGANSLVDKLQGIGYRMEWQQDQIVILHVDERRFH